MRTWLYVLTTAALGCGRGNFDPIYDGDVAGDGAGSDGSSDDDGGGGLCVGAVPASTFPGPSACSDWGGNAQTTNGMLTEVGGALQLTPFPNSAGANVSCLRGGVTIGSAGAFTEVSVVLPGATSTTRLEVLWGGETYYIGAMNGIMRAGAVNMGVAFSGGTIGRWWRIRPIGPDVVFETSPDGFVWDDFGQIGGVPTGVASLRVVAATPVGVASPGTARFESVNVCP